MSLVMIDIMDLMVVLSDVLFIVIIFILYYFYCYMLVEDCFILKYCID